MCSSSPVAGRGMSISPRNPPAMAFAFLVLAVVAGSALPVQAGLNARLATFVGGPIRASMISFALGTLVLLVLSLLVTRGVVNTSRLNQVPWWAWLRAGGGAGCRPPTAAAGPPPR